MKKNIMDIINCMNSENRYAVKLAKELANIPTVEFLRVWNSYDEEDTAPHIKTSFMAIHATFDWHGNRVDIHENYNGKLIVEYNHVKIGEIFWSALYGKLEAIPNYTQLKLTKAQEYILDSLWKAVYKISPKGKPYSKCALPKKVQYGDCTIWAEGATIYAENGEKKERIMGNRWRGNMWTNADSRFYDIQNVIKKAFITY